MNTDLLIENVFSISPTDILQNLSHTIKSATSGNNTHYDINCWLEDPLDSSSVTLNVNGVEPQMLTLEFVDIHFGQRAYFVCTCGLRTTKLYLPANTSQFQCRKCHKLQYQLTTFNKNSVAGKALYQLNRLQKLTQNRESMDRVFYRGEYTKKFKRFLGLCDKAGFNAIVEGANQLRELVHK